MRHLNVKLGVIACMCLLTAAISQAASYSWNPAGGPAGTWDLSSSNWYLTSNVVWPNAIDSIAVFGSGNPSGTFATGGAVTVSNSGNAITVNGITFNLTGYTISGDPLSLTGTAPAITVTNGGTTAEIDSNITPTTDFTVAGSGNLILGGNVSSTSTKNLTMSGAGTLTLGGAIGTGDNSFINLNVTAGTVILNKTSSTSSIHAANSVTGVSALTTLQLGSGGYQLASTISGLEGTFDLNGQNETNGTISGTAGTVTNSANGTASILTINSGTGTFAGTIQDHPTLGTGTVGLTVSGGTQTLSGNNTYAGGTIISGGTLNINSNTALGATAGTVTISGGTLGNSSGALRTLSNNNAINLNGNFTFAGPNDLNLGAGAVTLGATPTITVNAGTLTVGGAISGSGWGITKAGTGTLVLGVANTYSGTTTISAGNLQINSASALSGGGTPGIVNLNGGTLINNTGATLTLANVAQWGSNFGAGGNGDIDFTDTGAISTSLAKTIAISSTSGSRTLEVCAADCKQQRRQQRLGRVGAGNTLLLDRTLAISPAATNRTLTINGDGNLTVTGAVVDGGTATASPLIYSGWGTMTLNGANTYRGATTVYGGTVSANFQTAGVSSNDLSAAALTLGGTVRLTGRNTVATTQTFASTGLMRQHGLGLGTYKRRRRRVHANRHPRRPDCAMRRARLISRYPAPAQ